MLQLRSIESIDLKDKKVFLRLDLNVPLKGDEITDDTRIQEALPTIKYILERTSKLAIASHLGRPKAQVNAEFSLAPVGERLGELLGRDMVLYDGYLAEPASASFAHLEKNQILLLENLRFHPGEEANDRDFAISLMAGFDVYVNDAFGTCHRAHASVAQCAELISKTNRGAGFLIQKEVKALGELLDRPQHPFTVVLGGAKVSDKMGVILSLLERCQCLVIGGAMAYTFLAFKGHKVGTSKIEKDKMNLVKDIFDLAEKRRVRIILPVDHVGAAEFAETAKPVAIDGVDIPDNLMGLDIGPKTSRLIATQLQESKTVFWNGPMGVFEWPAFASGSFSVAKALAASPATSIVGGGDSVSALEKAGVADKISHVSTGGGASLEFLEGLILPGLKVLSV